jgi:uncharacterized membrane protein
MYVGSQTIALYVFIITLAAFLVIFSYMNAYAKRAKHKAVMRCIALALTAGQIVLDIVYLNIMHYETMIRDNPVPVTPDISSSQFWTVVHLVALGITLLAMLSLPLYHKLILKINTTISDDEGEAFAGVGSNDEKLTWDEDQWA